MPRSSAEAARLLDPRRVPAARYLSSRAPASSSVTVHSLRVSLRYHHRLDGAGVLAEPNGPPVIRKWNYRLEAALECGARPSRLTLGRQPDEHACCRPHRCGDCRIDGDRPVRAAGCGARGREDAAHHPHPRLHAHRRLFLAAPEGESRGHPLPRGGERVYRGGDAADQGVAGDALQGDARADQADRSERPCPESASTSTTPAPRKAGNTRSCAGGTAA